MGGKFLYTLPTYTFWNHTFPITTIRKQHCAILSFSIQKIILYLVFSNTFKNIFFDGTKFLKKNYKRQHFHKNSARMIPILGSHFQSTVIFPWQNWPFHTHLMAWHCTRPVIYCFLMTEVPCCVSEKKVKNVWSN